MVADEGRVGALALQELADQLVQQARRGVRRAALHLVLLALQDGSPVSLVAPAREMSMLLATIAGLYLLREPVGWGRMLGCILIGGGVILLASS